MRARGPSPDAVRTGGIFARLRGSFEHTPRTLELVWRSSRRACVLLAALTLVAAVLPVGVAYAGKAIVDAVVARSAEATIRWVLAELALVGALALVQRGLMLSRQLLGARLSIDVNGMILEKALTLELRHFEDAEFYDRLTRARREASSRPLSMVIESFQLVQNALTLAGYALLLKLLTRLYEPTEGRILLDGRDLREWDPETLRRRIGVVFQDFAEYQFTARENVGMGSVDHLDDEERVGHAVELGGAREVVEKLPKGLETQLGRWFKDGVELSGGQWQKIALSRAFMREEADILVLDEPTAALDAEAEHAVFERFRTLAKGRTTILISHRFPTVRMADRILVLEGGRVVEEGTHERLVATGGRYAELFRLQAKGYL